jgi:DNA-binding MarR family transcriptional regulator
MRKARRNMLRQRSTLLRVRTICNTPPMARDDRLFLKLWTTSQYADRIVERQLEPLGIPAYQLGVVTHIRHNQPVTPTELAALSGIPPTTLRDNIQRLVDRRLARRIRHPDDGRSYLLELTARGDVMARAAGPALAKAYAQLERALPRSLAEYEAIIDELNAGLESTLAPQVDADAPNAAL